MHSSAKVQIISLKMLFNRTEVRSSSDQQVLKLRTITFLNNNDLHCIKLPHLDHRPLRSRTYLQCKKYLNIFSGSPQNYAGNTFPRFDGAT